MNPPQRLRGTVRMWDDEKGFGFIEPAEGGVDVFLHMRALGQNPTRPRVGSQVTYCLTTDQTGRPRAAFARVESGATASLRMPPIAWAFLGSAGFIGALGVAARFHAIAWWVPEAYGAASGFTFIAYALDKARAIDAARRVPENTLHLLELLGGWPGALFAQQCLRHKTAKSRYQLIFWLIVALHLGLWAWWVFADKTHRP